MGGVTVDEEESSNEIDEFGNKDEEGGPFLNDGGIADKPATNVYEESYANYMVLYSLYGLLQIVGLVSIILAFRWSNVYMKGFSWDGSGTNFNWHVVCMTLFVFLYGNAAVVYRVLRKTEKMTAKMIHGALNAGSFLFAVIGLIAVFRFHNVNKIPNAYSLHSWVGIGTVSLYACQLVFGFLAFLYPTFSNDNIRRAYLGIHVYFGGVLLALAVVACVSGITEKMLFQFKAVYGSFGPVTFVANFFGVSISLFVMIVGYILYNSNWKRVIKSYKAQ